VRVLGELAAAIDRPAYAAAILEQARRLAAECAHGFPEADLDELNIRLGTVERAAAAYAQ
jgi:hypothetical protein